MDNNNIMEITMTVPTTTKQNEVIYIFSCDILYMLKTLDKIGTYCKVSYEKAYVKIYDDKKFRIHRITINAIEDTSSLITKLIYWLALSDEVCNKIIQHKTNKIN